jgi:phage tail tape-measure protein
MSDDNSESEITTMNTTQNKPRTTYAERLAKRIARRRAPVTPQGKAARAAAMARRREAAQIRDERAQGVQL